MWTPLAYVIVAACLGVGAWCLASGIQGRFLNQAQYTALLVLAGVVIAQGLVATVLLVAGQHPVEFATFLGYLFTATLFLPAGIALLRMEPTRWGSIIGGGAALTVAVLTLRLLQVWTPLT